MKHYLLLLALLTCPTWASANDVPDKLDQFQLGSNIDGYQCSMYDNYLQTKVIPMEGVYRKATLYYGTCKYPKKILKMKFKYQDRSREFFDTLHAKINKKYGQKAVWEGDSFGIFTSWKWHFIDENGDSVTMAIEYNQKNPELSVGSVIKIAYPVKINEELICTIKKNNIELQTPKMKPFSDEDWQAILPQ